eukprot:TRINITY_DN1627_c0_g1_i1.p2 TRINITY_DN1627_c0_g1~~TRINITY_DN1627_c0_g1_i1.p2  ORF type:complete len:273 (-),score=35.55 TRINITY_DN1627_c0_g1_i1:363-1181(-)
MACLNGPAPLRACLCWLFLSLAQVARAHPVYWTKNHGHCQHPMWGWGGHGNPRPDGEISFQLVHKNSGGVVTHWQPGNQNYQLKVEHNLRMEYFITTTVGKLWQPGTDYSSCNGSAWFAGGGSTEIHIIDITMPDCCQVKETEMVVFATGAGGQADYYHQNSVSFTGNLDNCQCDAAQLAALPDPLPPLPESHSSSASAGLASWADALIALAVIAVVAAVAVGAFLYVRQKRAQRQLHGMEDAGSYSKWTPGEPNGKPNAEPNGKPNTLEEC